MLPAYGEGLERQSGESPFAYRLFHSEKPKQDSPGTQRPHGHAVTRLEIDRASAGEELFVKPTQYFGAAKPTSATKNRIRIRFNTMELA
jgi:hypothetical protein